MSSCVISKAELERRKQLELEQRRQELFYVIREAATEYNLCLGQLENFRSSVVAGVGGRLEKISESPELELASEEYTALSNRMVSLLERQINSPIPIELSDITSLTQKLREELAIIKKQYNSGLSTLSNRIKIYASGQEELGHADKFSALLSGIEREKQIDYGDIRFDTGVKDKIGAKKNEAELNAVIDECLFLINNDAISASARGKFLGILDGITENSNSPDRVAVYISQYTALQSSVKKDIHIFNELYVQYLALCIEHGKALKARQSLAQMPKSEFGGIKELETEILWLEQESKTENERTYIREQIDEVMVSFGYRAAESIVMQGTTKGEHLLFESVSDAAPLHCYMSDSGSIMLEPVGIANETTSDDCSVSTIIAETEREAIFEEQVTFCKQHPKIIEELAKRGVIIGNTNIREAGAKYAKQLRIKGKSWTGDKKQSQQMSAAKKTKLRAVGQND